MSVAQRLLERRVQLLRRDLALLEVLRHQRLVDFDDLVDERAVRAAHRREVGLAVGIEEAVDDALAAAGGKIDRQAFLAEQRLDRRQHGSGRSTFSASILLTMTSRQSRRFAAQSIIRDAIISMPDWALTTTAAVSTASSAPIACPMKSGNPGVSTR